MKVSLVIRTDSVRVCNRVVEAPLTVDAVLDALRQDARAVKVLRDLPFAAICIQARPFDHLPPARTRTLDQEARGA